MHTHPFGTIKVTKKTTHFLDQSCNYFIIIILNQLKLVRKSNALFLLKIKTILVRLQCSLYRFLRELHEYLSRF